MSDTPRTDGLLERLEKGRFTVFDAQPHLVELARTLERQLTAAQSVRPEAAVWISVKERVPESNGRVLAAGNGVAGDDVVGVAIWRDGEWDWRFHQVTHWQPLPPPPQSGSPK